MSQQDIKPVLPGTATLVALSAGGSRRLALDSGNGIPDSGKSVPAVDTGRPDLQEIAGKLNRASRRLGRDLHFEVDLTSGRSVIQVLDRETGEIIRQIPPEKAQTLLSGNGSVAIKLYDERV